MGVLLAAVALVGAAWARLPADPYGVCCHITRNWAGEWTDREVLFEEMKRAGISWIRADIDADSAMPKYGQFNDDYIRRALAPSTAGLSFLPILPGRGVSDIAWPWHGGQKLENYAGYVRHCAEVCAPAVKYWEIWNEPNAGGDWNPDPVQLARTLERSWKEIKGVDPAAKILYAGVCGVPVDWVEASLKAGAGKWFDVMNLHTYCAPESVPGQIAGLRGMMAKYGVGDRPIWLTEYGTTATPCGMFYAKVLPVAFRELGLDPAVTPIACAVDARYECARIRIPGFRTVELSFDEVRRIDPKKYPVLKAGRVERVPAELVDALERYVREGGTLLLPEGLPMYFEQYLDDAGNLQERQVDDRHMARFHLAWDSWWTRKGMPAEEAWQRTCGAYSNDFVWVDADHPRVGRAISTRNLKPGDTFTPYVELGRDDFRAPFIGLFRFNSDLRGNILLCVDKSASPGSTQEAQAAHLARSVICNFAAGAERIFWYCFRDNQAQKEYFEAHFGLVHRDNRQKKAYWALRLLAKDLLPGGSTVPEITRSGDRFLARWTRPDGERVTALWTTDRRDEGVEVKVDAAAAPKAAFDLVGTPLAVPDFARPVKLTTLPFYLLGGEVSFSADSVP